MGTYVNVKSSKNVSDPLMAFDPLSLLNNAVSNTVRHHFVPEGFTTL